MKSILKLVTLSIAAIFTFGCAQNYYNIPKETYEKKVRVLGVAPIFIDPESDIRHPEKEALVSIVKESNRKNEKELVALLKDTGTYFSVGLLPDDADRIFSTIFSRRERREDAGVIYNKYFFKGPELKDLMARNKLDALMVVAVSGLTAKDKVYSGNLLSYLESHYNYLTMTAQILDADGNTLWEYPNFRQRTLSFSPFFPLQYPDFDEAKANENDRVDVKFKTIAGIGRGVGKTVKSSVQDNGRVSTVYSAAFDDMVLLLKPEFDWFGLKKEERPAPVTASVQTRPAPAAVHQPTAPQTAPSASAPPLASQPAAEPVIQAPTVREETL
ncbi:MAG: hypothetical protein FD174_1148 [Geobacteraceae bacterium]|nr:MAG: hypothetical protein FD174_1148 [Geobacteraceae bacterium]